LKIFYDSPYIYLAKIVLKLGDKNECIKILEECYHALSNEYYTYDFGSVREDKDFDALKTHTKFQYLIAEKPKEEM